MCFTILTLSSKLPACFSLYFVLFVLCEQLLELLETLFLLSVYLMKILSLLSRLQARNEAAVLSQLA